MSDRPSPAPVREKLRRLIGGIRRRRPSRASATGWPDAAGPRPCRAGPAMRSERHVDRALTEPGPCWRPSPVTGTATRANPALALARSRRDLLVFMPWTLVYRLESGDPSQGFRVSMTPDGGVMATNGQAPPVVPARADLPTARGSPARPLDGMGARADRLDDVRRVVPMVLRVGAALGWRLFVVVAALSVIGAAVAYLAGVVIPVAIALLLAALLSPRGAGGCRRTGYRGDLPQHW